MSSTGWSSNTRAGDVGVLASYQESLRVHLIATPRANFVTCQPQERIDDVLCRNNPELFDTLPVVSGDGRILGLFSLIEPMGAQTRRSRVDAHMQPLGESHVIGADASILDFIRTAPAAPLRMVVSGRQISGLVSLSDLQRLPVRAALFALVTHLEMMMAEVIRLRFPARADWAALLSTNRRIKLDTQVAQAMTDNTLVDELNYTQFCDKRAILAKCMVDETKAESGLSAWYKDMKCIEVLRNNVAHANAYAGSRQAALHLCDAVQAMDFWIARLAQIVEARHAAIALTNIRSEDQ